MHDDLSQLMKYIDEADKDLRLAEEKARAAWVAYWNAKDEYHIGDVVQHPTLRSRGVWVIRDMDCTAKGELQFTLQEVVNGIPKRWRKMTRDGLLRVVRCVHDTCRVPQE